MSPSAPPAGGATLPFLAVTGLEASGPLLSALGLPDRHSPRLVLELLGRMALLGQSAGGAGGGAGGGSGGGSSVALEPECVWRVYRYLEAASQQEEEVFGEVCAAFGERPLIWLAGEDVWEGGER